MGFFPHGVGDGVGSEYAKIRCFCWGGGLYCWGWFPWNSGKFWIIPFWTVLGVERNVECVSFLCVVVFSENGEDFHCRVTSQHFWIFSEQKRRLFPPWNGEVLVGWPKWISLCLGCRVECVEYVHGIWSEPFCDFWEKMPLECFEDFWAFPKV